MKKNLLKLFSIFTVLLAFSSCSKKTDEFGWYYNFEDAQKVAQSKNKGILLFVNSIYDSPESYNAVKLITESKEFVSKLSDFVCVHFDFSDPNIFQANIPTDLTDDEQKAFEKKRAKYEKQFFTADKYVIKNTPTLLMLTKEGYFVSSINFDYLSNSVDGYVSKIILEKDSLQELNQKVALTSKGSNLDKVKAIDQLFQSQDELYRPLLIDLYKKIPSLDKENSSGLVPKYIREIANAEAFESLIKFDFESAVNTYIKAADDKRNTPEDKQYLYTLAVNVESNSFNPNIEKIISLLNQAIEFAPETEDAKNLNLYLTEIQKQQ